MYVEPWLSFDENPHTPVDRLTWHAEDGPSNPHSKGTFVLHFSDSDPTVREEPHATYKRIERAVRTLDAGNVATVLLGLRTPQRSRELANRFANNVPYVLPDRAVNGAARLHSVSTGHSRVHLRGGSTAMIAAAYVRTIEIGFSRITTPQFRETIAHHADHVEHNASVFAASTDDDAVHILCDSPTTLYDEGTTFE